MGVSFKLHNHINLANFQPIITSQFKESLIFSCDKFNKLKKGKKQAKNGALLSYFFDTYIYFFYKNEKLDW